MAAYTMDVTKYIESGILEEYCLGLLNKEEQASVIQASIRHPEIKNALIMAEERMEGMARAGAVEPNSNLKGKILAELGFNDEATEGLPRLTPVDGHSKKETWLKALSHLIPDSPTSDFSSTIVGENDDFQQMLVITKANVPEEEHEDYLESFFILQGHCACTIGSDLFELHPGDFLEIPLHVKHDIKIVSPYVTAILQYQFV